MNKRRRHREIERSILRLRAEGYRQSISGLGLPKSFSPLSLLGTYFALKPTFSAALTSLMSKEKSLPERLLLGVGLFIQLWRKYRS